jgi:hypothetical protein
MLVVAQVVVPHSVSVLVWIADPVQSKKKTIFFLFVLFFFLLRLFVCTEKEEESFDKKGERISKFEKQKNKKSAMIC